MLFAHLALLVVQPVFSSGSPSGNEQHSRSYRPMLRLGSGELDFHSLAGNPLAHIASFLPLRSGIDLAVPAVLPFTLGRKLFLNKVRSRQYIDSAAFRRHVNRKLPGCTVVLNLGEAFLDYLEVSIFRADVDALVHDPATQITSDITALSWFLSTALDFRSLASLKNLEDITIYQADISSLQGLDSLENLRRLIFRRCRIHDSVENAMDLLAPLTRLPRLRALRLNSDFGHPQSDWRIDWKNYSEIGTLRNLEVLHLGYTDVSDLRFLRGMANLRELSLCGLGAAERGLDLEQIEHLKDLRILDLTNGHFTHYANLGSLQNLERLSLSSLYGLNPTENRDSLDTEPYLTFLRQLSNLKRLDLSKNDFSGLPLDPLTALTQLEELDLSHAIISNLDFLPSMPNLRLLNLEGTQPSDIPLPPLEHLARLTITSGGK